LDFAAIASIIRDLDFVDMVLRKDEVQEFDIVGICGAEIVLKLFCFGFLLRCPLLARSRSRMYSQSSDYWDREAWFRIFLQLVNLRHLRPGSLTNKYKEFFFARGFRTFMKSAVNSALDLNHGDDIGLRMFQVALHVGQGGAYI